MLLWWPARADAGSPQGREGGFLAGSCSSWKRRPSEHPGWQWCSLLPPTGKRKVCLLRLNPNLLRNLIATKTTFALFFLQVECIFLFLCGGRSMSPDKFTIHNLTWKNKTIQVRPSSQFHLGAIRISWSLYQKVRTHFLSAGEIEWCHFVICGNLKTLASWPAPELLPKVFIKSYSTLSNSKWNTRWMLLKSGGCANLLN